VSQVELYAIEDCGHLIWVGPGAAQARETVLTFLTRHVPAAGGNAASRSATVSGPNQPLQQTGPA